MADRRIEFNYMDSDGLWVSEEFNIDDDLLRQIILLLNGH